MEEDTKTNPIENTNQGEKGVPQTESRLEARLTCRKKSKRQLKKERKLAREAMANAVDADGNPIK